MMHMILESELLLSILDGETNLGTVYLDDGFCGAQERLTQNDGYPYISACVQNHKVYGNI